MSERIVKDWIEKYIIELNLCPFAKATFSLNKMKFYNLDIKNLAVLEDVLISFIQRNIDELDTSFIVLESLHDYEEFIEFYYNLEEFILESEKLERIKLIAFHPNYRHGGEDAEYIHYTNIAPFPIIQLLDSEHIKNVSNKATVDNILRENEVTLKKKGVIQLQKIIDELK